MEIPEKLAKLYRHWGRHVERKVRARSGVALNQDVLGAATEFAAERMRAWERKTAGAVAPWSEDRVITTYRFCNIYRELDRQTIAIHEMLASLREDFPRWLLNCAFCRFVANPETVAKVGLLSPSDTEWNETVMARLLALPRPKFGDAYIFPISAIQKGEHPTRESFFCRYLPSRIKAVARAIRLLESSSVAEALPSVLAAFGFNLKFHWTEILIDVAYQFPDRIDLFGRFPVGPGSLPTMRRLAPNAEPEDVVITLVAQQPANFPHLTLGGKPILLSAENWEGVGCEFRKYENLRRGAGRRRIYRSRQA